MVANPMVKPIRPPLTTRIRAERIEIIIVAASGQAMLSKRFELCIVWGVEAVKALTVSGAAEKSATPVEVPRG